MSETLIEASIQKELKDHNLKDERALRARLDGARVALERHLSACERAVVFAQELSDRLKEERERYASEVLTPVNELVQRYWAALSSFHEWRLSIEARPHKNNTQLEMAMAWSRGTSEGWMSPERLLSEGQLSAFSLCLLFAMSTAYRWSRWRGLLLDDPVEHNDVIHMAAFADLLRNLVREGRYQVVVATHDLELGDFLRRKMVSGGIECATCRLVGPGVNGVRYVVE